MEARATIKIPGGGKPSIIMDATGVELSQHRVRKQVALIR
jgi:hypothetical protein